MPAQTYSLEQFGQKIKEKYPEYGDVDNKELGQRMLEKYPEYNDRIGNISNTQPPIDYSNYQDSSYSQPAQSEGLLKSITKSVAKPFAEIGTSAYNVGSSIKKLAGGDVQGAAQALEQSRNIPFLGETKPAFTGQESTLGAAKKIAGYGADIGSTILPVGAGSQIIKQGGKGLIKEGVKQGTKYGFATGFGQSFGGELEKGDEGSIVRAVGKGISGGAVGAPLGAATGLVGAGLANRIKNTVAIKAEKSLNDALKVIKPELSKLEKEAAIKAGRGQIKGVLKTTEIAPNQRDYEVAETVKNIVSPKKTNVANINNLRSEIDKSANEVISGLKQNDAIYNKNQIKSILDQSKNAEDRQLTLAGDEASEKAYDGAVSVFMKILDRKPKTLSGLLEARKEFDQVAKRTIKNIFEKDSVKSLAVQDVRKAANDFIAAKLPVEHPFQSLLRRQNLMYEAIENISKITAKDVGKNIIQKTIEKAKKNPLGAAIVGSGIGTGVASLFRGE